MEWKWEGLQNWSLCPTFGTVAISFLVFAVILWPIERFWPDQSGQRVRRGGFHTDLAFWVFTPLVSKAVTYGVVIGTAEILLHWLGRPTDIFAGQGWGAIGRQPFWLQSIEVFVVADFVFYWTHRWFHTTRLWPFHAVHHSSMELDWLSSMRFHPVNDALTRLCQGVPLVLLGFSPGAVVCALPIVVVFIIVTHANVPWSWGPLRRVFVSPIYHHWHHSSEPEAIDKNFAGALVLWDWLFGTLYLPGQRRPKAYGIVADDVPKGIVGQLIFPFHAVFQPRKHGAAATR